jgi:hypothetical protein
VVDVHLGGEAPVEALKFLSDTVHGEHRDFVDPIAMLLELLHGHRPLSERLQQGNHVLGHA